MLGLSLKKQIKKILKHLHLWGLALRARIVLHEARRTFEYKRNYSHVLKRIRNKKKDVKIKVLFLVGEPAKWKCQKLYEEMQHSGVFEPVIGLTAWNLQSVKFMPKDEDLNEFHSRAEAFFTSLGDRCVRTYTLFPRKAIELSAFSPDVVFYSEPWAPASLQLPEVVSKYALTFYVPYFVPSHGNIKYEGHLGFHRFLYAYICMNEAWAKLFRDSWLWWECTTRFIGLGHPALDFFGGQINDTTNEFIVYAPHFSIPHPDATRRYVFPFGTFPWSGKALLEYARLHPEQKWVFKPHPILRKYLEEYGFMSHDEVEAYYKAWETIGIAKYDSAYQELFLHSRALITDCCSFLTEYGATGKPIIHLKRRDTGITPLPPSKKVFDTFYEAYNLDEMQKALMLVIEEGLDPKCVERRKAISDANISDGCASERIINYLKRLMRR